MKKCLIIRHRQDICKTDLQHPALPESKKVLLKKKSYIVGNVPEGHHSEERAPTIKARII